MSVVARPSGASAVVGGAASAVVSPHASLVRYDNPVLVATTKDGRGGGGGLLGAAAEKAKRRAEEKQHLTPTEDILNSILPPREWTEDGQLWVQYVSSTPATRSDVLTLQAQLDHKLQQRQARETGICPIREELYAQCFDELIREVTINCAERGLLLLRVRDELRMTIASYQTLYESSIAFGMRKALQSEQHKVEMMARIKALEAEKREYEKILQEWKLKCDAVERKDAERRQEEQAKHKEEVDFLAKHNQALKKELEQLLSIPSSLSA